MIVQPPALADYRDSFDRADSTDLGTAWRPEVSSCKIATNRAQARTQSSNTARNGAWETYVGDYGGRLFTDNWEIPAPLIAPVGTASDVNFTGIGCGMFDGGPGTGMVLVYMAVTRESGAAGGTRIMTYAADSIPAPATLTGLTGQTVRASDTTAIPTTATIAFRRRMVTATRSVFTAFIDGVSALTWDDITGIVPAGDDYRRRWFIVAEANYPQFFNTRYSPALASVRAYDITV